MVNIVNTAENIFSRHSYRGTFDSTPVPRDHLRMIMEAGLVAPSCCNKQTTSLIGVDDPQIECSQDGVHFSQMRICHMWNAAGEIRFGIYACSPEKSSFKATFTHMEVTECTWLAHDGQAPDDK